MILNKILCCVLLFMFVLACGQEEPDVGSVHIPSEIVSHGDTDCATFEMSGDVSIPCEDRWICHSPSTKMHNQVCTSECMVPGDNRTYCWLKECRKTERR